MNRVVIFVVAVAGFLLANAAEGQTSGKGGANKRIAAAVPAGLDVHLILDNYGTHKTSLIHRWLARHPRFHVHFTPTSVSWLNLVERWFAALTEKQIRRGVRRSTRELE